jgi:hypothetical protein
MTAVAGSQAFIGIIAIASALFILALKWMNAPPTARRGILSGEWRSATSGALSQLASTANSSTSASTTPDFYCAGYQPLSVFHWA